MEEIWKPYPEDPRYLVSNYGYIKGPRGFILKGSITNGYYRIGLYNGNKKKWEDVHRIVAKTFIPNPDNKPVVNHKDGNKLNNKIDNLEWCTQQHNIREAFRLGLNKYTYKENFKNNPKTILQFDKNNKLIKKYTSIREANRITGICYNSIFMNCHGKQKYAGDYIWKFEEEI